MFRKVFRPPRSSSRSSSSPCPRSERPRSSSRTAIRRASASTTRPSSLPVGGNTGTTLGQQRLIAFQAAADKWGATLTSGVTIVVYAHMGGPDVHFASAVLGSAGAVTVWRNFTGAPVTDHWYPAALASKLFGTDVDPEVADGHIHADIRARFNVNLGQTGCLDGVFFYLGLDNNHGANIDLVTVLEHEFAHGLGFQTFTSGSTGAQLAAFPSHLGRLPPRHDDGEDLDRHDGRRARDVGPEHPEARLERRERDGGRAVGPPAGHASPDRDGARRPSRARTRSAPRPSGPR